jgi:O-antigen/teichoic acid export membrane protein
VRAKILELAKGKLVKNVMIVAGGTAASQLIALLVSPILTRMYGPEAYGELGLFLSYVAIFASISSLTYANAIVLPKDDDDSRDMVRLSLYLSSIIAIAVVAIGLIFPSAWTLIGAGSIEKYALLIPVVAWLSSVSLVFDQWLIRKANFSRSSKIVLTQSVFDNSAKLGMGSIWPGSLSLILVSITSQLITAYQSLRAGFKSIGCDLYQLIRPSNNLINVAKEYRSFPTYRAPEILFNTFSQSAPILMLSALFGPGAAGLYSIANRIIFLPFTVISQAVGKVLLQKITEVMHADGEIFPLLLRATLVLAGLGIPFFIPIIIWGPDLFGFIFGARWAQAGEYARWLSLWAMAMFCNVPVNVALPHLKLQAHALAFEIFITSGRVLMLWLGFKVFESSMVAVMLFAIFGMAINLSWVVYILVKAKQMKVENYV